MSKARISKKLEPNEISISAYDDDEVYVVRAYGQWAKVISKLLPELLIESGDDGVAAKVTPVQLIHTLGKLHKLTGYRAVKPKKVRKVEKTNE